MADRRRDIHAAGCGTRADHFETGSRLGRLVFVQVPRRERDVAGPDDALDRPVQDAQQLVHVACRGVMETGDPPVAALGPMCNRGVKLGDRFLTHAPAEPCLEELANQWVEPEARFRPFLTTRQEPEPFAFSDQPMNGCRIHAARDLGGLGLDRLKDGRPHEEVLVLLRELADDLLGEIVVEIRCRPGQRSNERARFDRRALADGRTDEMKRGRPALGSAGEIGQDVALERVPVRLAKQLTRLGFGESQVHRAHLGELAM